MVAKATCKHRNFATFICPFFRKSVQNYNKNCTCANFSAFFLQFTEFCSVIMNSLKPFG